MTGLSRSVLAQLPQITAQLDSADGTGVVYITTDPTLNKLTLTLTNGLSQTVSIPAGSPVAYDDPTAAGAVYVFFEGLLANDEIAAIDLSAPGWSAQSFVDARGLAYLVAAPADGVALAHGAAIDFAIGNLVVGERPGAGNATVTVAGAGLPAAQASVPCFISIGNPPSKGDRDLVLTTPLRPDVVLADEASRVVLGLVNPGPGPLVPGGTSAWHGRTPAFQLTPVCGDGPAALTTIDDAAQMAVTIADANGNVWRAPRRETQGAAPYWVLEPDPNGGGEVLGAGESATLELAITGLTASLPPALGSAFALLRLSWSSVPGFKDGSLPIVLTKKQPPLGLSGVAASAETIILGQSVALSWYAHGVDHVTLSYRIDGDEITESSEPPGTLPLSTSGYALAPTRDTIYTLTAFNDSGGQIDEVPVPVDVDHPPVVIASFSASASMVDATGGPQTITLSWDVADAVSVYVNDAAVAGTSCDVEIAATATFELRAVGHQDRQGTPPTTATAEITVYAFRVLQPARSGDVAGTYPLYSGTGRNRYVNVSRREVGEDGTLVMLWDISAPRAALVLSELIRVDPATMQMALALSADGNTFYFVDNDGTLHACACTGDKLTPISSSSIGAPFDAGSLLVSDDESCVVVGNWGNEIYVFERQGHAFAVVQTIAASCASLVYLSRDGHTLYAQLDASDSQALDVFVRDGPTFRESRQIRLDHGAGAKWWLRVNESADGRYLVFCDYAGITVLDVASDAQFHFEAVVQPDWRDADCFLSPDNTRLFYSNADTLYLMAADLRGATPSLTLLGSYEIAPSAADDCVWSLAAPSSDLLYFTPDSSWAVRTWQLIE